MTKRCDHKFVDSGVCLKCGITFESLREADRLELVRIVQKQKLEIAKLRDALDDAVALLRDWEDYDVGDRECMWPKRREEFLAEHEEDGR